MKKCPFCAEETQDDAIVCWYCNRELHGSAGGEKGACQKVAAPGSQPSPERVNANKRVCAFIIDWAILSIIGIVLRAINTPGHFRYLILFTLFAFRDSIDGQSPGKMAVRLQVVNSRGTGISFLDSFSRNIILCWANVMYAVLPFLGDAMGAPNTAKVAPAIMVGIVSGIIHVVEYVIATRSSDGKRIGDMIANTRVKDLQPGGSGVAYAIWALLIIVVVSSLTYSFRTTQMAREAGWAPADIREVTFGAGALDFASGEDIQWILRAMATAVEQYASNNQGYYNNFEFQLNYDWKALNEFFRFPAGLPSGPYCGNSYFGYSISCDYSEAGYAITAVPVKGVKNYTSAQSYRMITGGVLQEF